MNHGLCWIWSLNTEGLDHARRRLIPFLYTVLLLHQRGLSLFMKNFENII